MSTIKNGKYHDAERQRLQDYDHPEYGPNLSKHSGAYSPSEIKDQIDNQSANWRRPIASDDD